MCGIFGFVTERPGTAGSIDARAALRALAHRGPDGSGSFSGAAGSTFCELVHSRLAIIDLSEGGHQPMQCHRNRYVVTYNGEIYNHLEVRRDLEREGIALRSTSDTEVLVEAYALWGPECLRRFRGMFAFAIWDRQLGDLFLARDRLGIKPLYVARSHDGLAFASEIRALLAAGAAKPRLSPEGLRSYFEWGSVAEPDTIIAGVSMLPPGSYLHHSKSITTIKTFWAPPLIAGRAISLEAAAEEVAPILREAVKLRLVSDVPVGIFLSGGVDSSVITAIASQESARPLQTFTVAFDGHTLSEGEEAAALASRFGCEHHTILLRVDDLRRSLDKALGSLDQPSADGTNTFFVAKAVHDAGISVALSGLGGDELFAGYRYFRQFGMAKRLAGLLPHGASMLEALGTANAFSGLPPKAAKLAALLVGDKTVSGAYAALRWMFTPSQVRHLLTEDFCPATKTSSTPFWGHQELPAGIDAINAFSILDLSHYMRNTLLRDADVMSMAHGLEVRLPLLDHRLVESVLSMAGHVKMRSGGNKPLLVKSSPPIPSRVPATVKRGFTLPFDDWLRGPLRTRVDEMLAPSSTSKLGFLSGAFVRELWSAFLAGDRRVTDSRIWCLVALIAWCDRNGVYL